jgi:hypothetical protein
MSFIRIVVGAAIGLGMGGASYAVPFAPEASRAAGGQSGVIPVHQTCHQEVRTHAVGPHTHHPYNCSVRMAGPGPGGPGGGGDCHANVQRHFVPGYGSIWHRHTATCEIDPYPNQGGPVPGTGGCIKVGPLTVCP